MFAINSCAEVSEPRRRFPFEENDDYYFFFLVAFLTAFFTAFLTVFFLAAIRLPPSRIDPTRVVIPLDARSQQ
jgi:hypothetical protein